ncbi:cell division protein FtsQ/DivIB [Dongia mobilis]|jgi:cell division protein FtsQ|uniref:cell division protein FtsQ/DivIB n=1 Tax=Dongia sp. TaxID=1977262 RepID=UPI0026EF5F5E
MRRVTAHKGAGAATMPMVGGMLRKRPISSTQRVPVRKRPKTALERHLMTLGIVLGLGMSVGGIGYWAISSGWIGYLADLASQRFVAASAEAGYALSSLEVEGRKETPKEDVMLALGALKGDAILDIDLEAARQRIVDLPWVTEAVVERRLPGALRVTLTEAEPLALWQKQGIFYLVSRTGDVLAVKDVARFGKLPVIVGDAAPQKAGELFTMLALEPNLQQRVTAAVLVGNRRWNLRLDNGVDVKLPELAADAAWMRLATLERQHRLLDKDISVIDLRQDDKLIVRQAHPAVAEDAEGAKKKSDQTAPAGKAAPEEQPILTPAATPLSTSVDKNNAT